MVVVTMIQALMSCFTCVGAVIYEIVNFMHRSYCKRFLDMLKICFIGAAQLPVPVVPCSFLQNASQLLLQMTSQHAAIKATRRSEVASRCGLQSVRPPITWLWKFAISQNHDPNSSCQPVVSVGGVWDSQKICSLPVERGEEGINRQSVIGEWG